MKRILFTIMAVLAICSAAVAQGLKQENPVKWKASVTMTSPTDGVVTLTATIDKTWHLYGTDIPDGVGPTATKITYNAPKGLKFKTNAPAVSPAPVRSNDEMFGAELSWWENKVTFTRKFKMPKNTTGAIDIEVRFMSCNNRNCRPPSTEKISVNIPKYVKKKK